MSAVASIVSMAIACAVMGAGASRIIIADTIIVRIYIMNSMPVIVTAAHIAIVTDAVPILIRIGTGCSRKIASPVIVGIPVVAAPACGKCTCCLL